MSIAGEFSVLCDILVDLLASVSSLNWEKADVGCFYDHDSLIFGDFNLLTFLWNADSGSHVFPEYAKPQEFVTFYIDLFIRHKDRSDSNNSKETK